MKNNGVSKNTAENEIKYLMQIDERGLVFRRQSNKETRELIYKDALCTGCWFCYNACPTKAIKVNPSGSVENKLADSLKILVDPEKCVLCGICAEVCIFNAFDLLQNGVSQEVMKGYPKFQRRWKLEEAKCKPKGDKLCDDCENACPRDALKCSLEFSDGKPKMRVEHDSNACVLCTSCKIACPEKAIELDKVFEGEIKVDLEKCQGCGICVDVCPTETLSTPKAKLGSRVDKLVINHDTCIYCSACVNACPVGALEVKRKNIKFVTEDEKSTTKRRVKIFNALLTEVAAR